MRRVSRFMISLALGFAALGLASLGLASLGPALGGILLYLATSKAWSQTDPPLFLFGIGIANITEKKRPPMITFEYRHPHGLWLFEPLFGFEYARDGAFYGFAGFSIDLFFKKHLVLTPDLAIGGHSPGSDIRLGHDIEFRSGASLAWRFDDGSRLGFSFHHLSNANLGKKNPGTESVVLYYTLPLSLP